MTGSGSTSICEVIAFPKTQSAVHPLISTPVVVRKGRIIFVIHVEFSEEIQDTCLL